MRVICNVWLAGALVGSGLFGCAAKFRQARAATQRFGLAHVAAPLDRSLFKRSPQGTISEDTLQRILGAAPELELPARVGVLPILPPMDHRGPAPDYTAVPPGIRPLVEALRRGEAFSMVTEMLPIPSGALGMEALRQIAARYRLRYLILYAERLQTSKRLNTAAALYATLIGGLFAFGHTLEVSGHIEATLFDVKTGLLLFTLRRPIRVEQTSTVFGHARKLAALARTAVVKDAPELAAEVRAETERFAEAASGETGEANVSVPARAPVPRSEPRVSVPGGVGAQSKCNTPPARTSSKDAVMWPLCPEDKFARAPSSRTGTFATKRTSGAPAAAASKRTGGLSSS
jgi:rhombotail lipoprotein